MVENFASFEYKTQEEPLTVIKSLTAVLSTAGMQLVETLSPSHLLTQLHAPTATQSTGQDVPMVDASGSAEPPSQSQTAAVAVPPVAVRDLGLMRSSIIVAMIMLLKAHLKTLYGISEE